MIKTERITINGRDFIRTYSDVDFLIERDREPNEIVEVEPILSEDGEVLETPEPDTKIRFEEAIDLLTSNYTYTETDEYIPGKAPDDEVSAEELAQMIEGVL